ncbi:hypothetical protein F4677DRAFT_448755 [Hypoxylon crocopeplum]|nr:hypothetical protein F4677DRAFT_448755 [Hypoxylon crocopeplum]
MLLFIATASLVWHVVLTFFVARDPRLLLKVARWATAIYLIGFGLFAAEVLREGLVVNGAHTLHWDARLAWALWFLLVAAGVADWRFLIPAAVLPLWVLSFPEVRTLLNYGLVRLGWLEVVHSPVSFVIKKHGLERVGGAVENVFGPAARAVKGVLDAVAALAPWAGPDMEKLRPVERWNGSLIGRWLRS